jgi:serine/threonine-protein kinase
MLDGIDLARLLDTGKTEVGLAVDFILQACSGLAEAHAAGIVHRDLKPGNLFLTRRPDGTPLIKVLDFGVAKIPLDEDDASLTKTSHVIGSPGYMAPEQLRSSKTVDVRADVWALGVILYELIRRDIHHATAVTEVAKVAMDEPPPLDEAPEGRACGDAMLAKEPGERPRRRIAGGALAPFASHDRAAAIAAAKVWIETPWQRAPLPTTRPTAEPSAAATKVDSPRGKREPDTTHQVGQGVIEAKPQRGPSQLAVVATIGTLALGGLSVFALTRGGSDAPAIDAPAAVVVVDAGAAVRSMGAAAAVDAQTIAKRFPLGWSPARAWWRRSSSMAKVGRGSRSSAGHGRHAR